MTGISHAITGAAIATIIKEPLFALPLAFLSHFVCDTIPHVGISGSTDKRLARRSTSHRIYLIDLTLLISFFALLIVFSAPWPVIAGAFLAGSPDFVWFYRYIITEKVRKKSPGPMNIISSFHSRIQWSETLRFGLPIEIVYSSILLIVIFNNL